MTGSSRSPITLWLALAVLALARAALAFQPAMWGWGFNLLRFVTPAAGWTLWLLSALALIPPLARRAAPLGRLLGDWLGESGAGAWRAPVALAVATGATVWLLPDRVHFVGDFLLRHGTAERALRPAALFPQALPLDVFLHYHLPREIAETYRVSVEITERALGALEASALAALAVAFARVLALRGAAALAASAVALGGGYLGLYTGYGKPVAEMTLLTLAVAVLGVRAPRTPAALLPLGLCLAAALTLHRSALGLVPAAGLAWVMALRAGPGWRSPSAALGLALPAVALAVMLPRIVATMLRWDPVHFVPPDVVRQGGVLGAMFAGTRPADLLNLVAVLSPLALAAPALALATGRPAARAGELGLLAALALPWVAMILLVHPPQGMYRDWDNFAAAGMAFSLVTAWLAAGILRATPRWDWLGLAVALSALTPAAQWLAHHADVDRGLARVAAFLEEPPARSASERGTTWDFLGIRNAQLARWDASAEALAHAAETAPSPRVLTEWALAEQARGNHRTAQQVFRRVVALSPDDPRAWFGLATASWNLGDYDECRRATLELARRRPGDTHVRRMLDDLERVSPTHGQAR